MKIPLVVAVKHRVIVSLTVRWNVEFLVPYETVYRNLGTRRKDIKVRFTSRNTFPTSISKNQKKSNLFMIVIMIVIIFHPFDLTMKSLLSVQPVVDGQKFGVFRLGGDPTNDILRNSGRQAFPTKEIYQIHVLLRTFQHQRSLAGIYIRPRIKKVFWQRAVFQFRQTNLLSSHRVQRLVGVHGNGRVSDDARSQLQRRDLEELVSGEIIAFHFDLESPGGVRIVHYDHGSGLLLSYERLEIDRVCRIWQFATRSRYFNAQRRVLLDF